MLTRSFKIYSLYFAQFLKTQMAYRWDFLASLLAAGVVASSGLLFVVFLIDGQTVPALRSWTRDEVLFIYGYSLLSTGLFSILSRNLYQFADRYIIQGQFDRVLLRPLNTLSQVLFESFNIEALGHFLVGFAVIFYSKNRLDMHFDMVDYSWLLLSAFSGALILISVFVFLCSLSFHFEDRLGIAPPFYNLITFGRYPLPIYSEAVQFVLRWIVPYGFVAFYPATHFFDSRGGFALYCYMSPLMALLCFLVAVVAWQIGVSKYASTGN